MNKEQMIPLVKKAQAGNTEAMDALFTAYYNDVYYFALKTVKDSDIACDITQETFLEMIRTIQNLKEPAAFPTWMRQIAYHQCTRHFRKQTEVTVEEDEDGNTIFDTLADEAEGSIPSEILEKEDFRQTILSMIDKLSAEQRSAVLLYYFDELSIDQIAKIQGVSEGTVKSRLNYARKSIRSSVEDYEKKNGIKLHSFAFLPLFMLFFGKEVMPQAKAATVRKTVMASAKATATATATTASGGVLTKLLSLPLLAKIGIGAVIIGLVIGSIAIFSEPEAPQPPVPMPQEYIQYPITEPQPPMDMPMGTEFDTNPVETETFPTETIPVETVPENAVDARLLQQVYSNRTYFTFTRDASGRVSYFTDHISEYDYFCEYNENNTLAKIERRIYREQGNEKVYYPDPHTTWTYEYNDKNQLIRSVEQKHNSDQPRIQTYHYNALDQLESILLENERDTNVVFTYNEQGQLVTRVITSSLGPVTTETYTYDAEGRVTQIFTSTPNLDTTHEYTYDENGDPATYVQQPHNGQTAMTYTYRYNADQDQRSLYYKGSSLQSYHRFETLQLTPEQLEQAQQHEDFLVTFCNAELVPSGTYTSSFYP